MKKVLFFLVCLLLIVIVVLIYRTTITKKENVSNSVDIEIIDNGIKEEDCEKVKSATSYFTVTNCISQYINYLSAKDRDSLYKIINEEYANTFKITKDNILDYVEKIDGNYEFTPTKMKVYGLGEDVQRYFVYGYIERLENIESIEQNQEKQAERKDFCVTVEFDLENMLFSITPFGYGGIYYEKNS